MWNRYIIYILLTSSNTVLYQTSTASDSNGSFISLYLHTKFTDNRVLRALQIVNKWHELSDSIKKEKVLFNLYIRKESDSRINKIIYF